MTEAHPPEPLLDRALLEAQTGGDRELAAELLDLFAQQCRRLMPGIDDASAAAAERADLAHTLKGSALGVGAGRVAGLSAAVEDRLRHGEPAEPALAALKSGIEETLAVLGEAP